jgi:hypothetical protein
LSVAGEETPETQKHKAQTMRGAVLGHAVEDTTDLTTERLELSRKVALLNIVEHRSKRGGVTNRVDEVNKEAGVKVVEMNEVDLLGD